MEENDDRRLEVKELNEEGMEDEDKMLFVVVMIVLVSLLISMGMMWNASQVKAQSKNRFA